MGKMISFRVPDIPALNLPRPKLAPLGASNLFINIPEADPHV
jgi:hypothetical protein